MRLMFRKIRSRSSNVDIGQCFGKVELFAVIFFLRPKKGNFPVAADRLRDSPGLGCVIPFLLSRKIIGFGYRLFVPSEDRDPSEMFSQ